MKRFLGTFSVLLFSLLLVLTSVGVSIETCTHSGKTEVAQIAVAQDSHGCGSMSHCMIVKTVRLAPVTLAEQTAFDFSQPFDAALSPVLLVGLLFVFVTSFVPAGYATVKASPPRRYLRLLRVLRL